MFYANSHLNFQEQLHLDQLLRFATRCQHQKNHDTEIATRTEKGGRKKKEILIDYKVTSKRRRRCRKREVEARRFDVRR